MELNEHALEQILTRQREEYQRYMSVQMEGVRSDMTRQREEYQQYMSVQIEGVRSDMKLLAEGVAGIQEQLIAVRDMVARNTEDIELMKMELSIIRNDLKEKVGREEFALLETRVAKLERSGRAR